MCGICCFSMRAIIVLDLISTFLLPACIFYIGYLCIMALFWAEIPPIMLLITIGLTVLVHIAVFLIRNRWDYWVWCVVYFLGESSTHVCVIICFAFSHKQPYPLLATNFCGIHRCFAGVLFHITTVQLLSYERLQLGYNSTSWAKPNPHTTESCSQLSNRRVRF